MSSAAGIAILDRFYPFPRLPKELRERIWELALIPSPSIQFFRIFCSYDDTNTRCCKAENQVVKDAPDVFFALGAPYSTGLDALSWIRDNPSGYVVENLLRRTCRGSRETALRLCGSLPGPWGSVGVSVPPQDGAPSIDLVFRFRPEQDLVCLQFHNGKGWPNRASGFLLDGPLRPGFEVPQLLNVHRLAVTYLLELDKTVDFRDVDHLEFQLHAKGEDKGLLFQVYGLGKLSWFFPQLDALYLIDYSIRLRSSGRTGESPATPAEEDVFCGNGLRFCEVVPGDSRWDVTSKVFELAAWLPGRYMPRHHMRYLYKGRENPEPPVYKVLACLPEARLG